MDPLLLFQSTAAIEADTARRRASAVDPTTVPGTASFTGAPITQAHPAAGGGEGLPAVGASGLGLASSVPASASGAPTAGFAGFGGGLGSSPNVPAPGTSINPATGLPHTAGLTRQELAAMKAQQDHGKMAEIPSALSGRQQAAAQLVGSGPVIGGPGQPGSPTMSEKSVLEDVTQRISTLGHKTYEALPPSIRDVFAEPKGKGPEGSPVKPRRGSAAAMFENVKNTASRLSHDFTQTVSNAIAEPEGYHPSEAGKAAQGLRRLSVDPPQSQGVAAGSPVAGRRDSQIRTTDKPTGVGSETSVFQQVKGFLSEAFEAPPAAGYPAASLVNSAVHDNANNKSLPSQENQGARPGEVSAGVGALPGKKDEAGVAVPPDVRAQEGTDHGHIVTSTGPTSTVPTGINSSPAPIPVPVSALDASAYTNATAVAPGPVLVPAQTGGSAHANVPVDEKTEVEKVVENLAEKAKNLLGFGSASSTGASDVEINEKERQREREMRGSDPIADGAVGAAFGLGAASLGGAGLAGLAGLAGTRNSGSSSTKGVSDLAPPIPATQTGVLDTEGTHLAPTSAPAGVPPSSLPSQIGTGHPASATSTEGTGGGIVPGSVAAGTGSSNVNAPATGADASGRSTPVPRAGALGAGSSDAVLTPSEAAVAQQAQSYMDAHPETGASEKDDKAAQAVLAAAGGSGLAGAGAYLAHKHDDKADSGMAVGRDEENQRPMAAIPPNERLDSLASVTAIRHGQPGDLHGSSDESASKVGTTGSGAPAASAAPGLGASPLAAVTSSGANDTTTSTLTAAGQKSTVRGTGPNHTTSLAPGSEDGSIGHPPTVAQGGDAVRHVGSYPKAQHEDAVGAAIKEAREGRSEHLSGEKAGEKEGVKEKIAEMTSASTSTPSKANANANGTTSDAATSASPAAARTSTSADRTPSSPAASTLASSGHGNGNGNGKDSSGHRRASSGASNDSKKVGFMKKLKGEMKVISGKLGNNEEKVALGEKIKHGEA